MAKVMSGRRAGSRSPARDAHRILIEECLAGADGAWDRFLDAYANLVYSTILKFDLPESEREEAFQTSVVAIYRQLPRLRDQDRLVPWIVGISSRQAINRIRARTREKRALAASTNDADGDSSDLTASLPDRTLLQLESSQMIHEALQAASPRCRRLISYLFLDDSPRSYDEIVKLERIPRGSIGPNRQRCLERMRRYLEERGWLK